MQTAAHAQGTSLNDTISIRKKQWVKFNFSDGRLAQEGYMKNGKRIGKWTVYYPSSKVRSKLKFNQKGEMHGAVLYFEESGNLTEQLTYKNGVLSGIYKKYYSNGQIQEIAKYKFVKWKSDVYVTQVPKDFTISKPAPKMAVKVGKVKLFYQTGRLMCYGVYDKKYGRQISITNSNSTDSAYVFQTKIEVIPIKVGTWQYFTQRGYLRLIETYENNVLKSSTPVVVKED